MEHKIIKSDDCRWDDNLPYDEIITEGTHEGWDTAYKAHIFRNKLIAISVIDYSPYGGVAEYSVRNDGYYSGRESLIKERTALSKSNKEQEQKFFARIEKYEVGDFSDIEHYQPYAIIYKTLTADKRIEVHQNIWHHPKKFTIVAVNNAQQEETEHADTIHEVSQKLSKIAGYKIYLL
jgi:hypothetical protein